MECRRVLLRSEGYVCNGSSTSPTPNFGKKISSKELSKEYNGPANRGRHTKSGAPNGNKKNTTCATGTYMHSMGASECIDCPPGYYCDVEGVFDISSKNCADGYVCTGGSTTPRPNGVKENIC